MLGVFVYKAISHFLCKLAANKINRQIFAA